MNIKDSLHIKIQLCHKSVNVLNNESVMFYVTLDLIYNESTHMLNPECVNCLSYAFCEIVIHI